MDDGARSQSVHVVHRVRRRGIQIQEHQSVEERSHKKMPPFGSSQKGEEVARQFGGAHRSVMGSRRFVAVQNRHAERLRLPTTQSENKMGVSLGLTRSPSPTHPSPHPLATSGKHRKKRCASASDMPAGVFCVAISVFVFSFFVYRNEKNKTETNKKKVAKKYFSA